MSSSQKSEKVALKVENVSVGHFLIEKAALESTIKEGYAKLDNMALNFSNPYEVLFLIQQGKVAGTDGSAISFSEMFKRLEDRIELTKYLVYKELRSKGYAVKLSPVEVFDLLANRGSNGYYVKILREGENYSVEDLTRFVKLSIKHRKEALVAIVERNGDVYFYRLFQISGVSIEGIN
ncbi:MAG: hypothetical protein ACP5GH_01010 [Nitrososphaeria archaeon]